MAIDLPDSLMSLDTTTTLTPPSQLKAALPTWTIPLSRLTTLQAILHGRRNGSTRHSLIVCVVSTEPVVQRQRKEEKSRGQEGSLWIGSWKVVAPPSGSGGGTARGGVEVGCGVKLWNEAAREWEGRVRRGDVVLLESTSDHASLAQDDTTSR